MKLLRIGLIVPLIWRLFSLVRMFWLTDGVPILAHGLQARYSVPRNKGSATSVRLMFELPAHLQFVLRPERRYDRFAKALGLATEWQTGDDGFDAAVFIIAEDPLLLDKLAVDAGLRADVVRLFAFLGVKSIRGWRGRLILEMEVPGDPKDDDEPIVRASIQTIASVVMALLERLAQVPDEGIPEDRSRAFRRHAWLSIAALVLAVGGIAGAFAMMGTAFYQVGFEAIHRGSAGLTGGIALVLITLTFAWLRTTPMAHRALLDVLFAALPGAWCSSVFGLTLYNQYADRTPVFDTSVHVENLEERRGRRSSKTYYLTVGAWPDPQAEREMQIRAADFRRMRTGQCLVVGWRAGALGDGWVDYFAPDESCPADTGR